MQGQRESLFGWARFGPSGRRPCDGPQRMMSATRPWTRPPETLIVQQPAPRKRNPVPHSRPGRVHVESWCGSGPHLGVLVRPFARRATNWTRRAPVTRQTILTCLPCIPEKIALLRSTHALRLGRKRSAHSVSRPAKPHTSGARRSPPNGNFGDGVRHVGRSTARELGVSGVAEVASVAGARPALDPRSAPPRLQPLRHLQPNLRKRNAKTEDVAGHEQHGGDPKDHSSKAIGTEDSTEESANRDAARHREDEKEDEARECLKTIARSPDRTADDMRHAH